MAIRSYFKQFKITLEIIILIYELLWLSGWNQILIKKPFISWTSFEVCNLFDKLDIEVSIITMENKLFNLKLLLKIMINWDIWNIISTWKSIGENI